MQTCTQCSAQSPDSATFCTHCQADLSLFSATSVSLQRMRNNPRVERIRVAVAHDCCPACREVEGSYLKDEVPHLPVEGCSHGLGCRCYYQPVLNEIYP